ncbi:hypothetical protein ASG60_17790 [Methylobacterium sp. Leaf469]|uniref:DUF29 domain-containing protein n=1 Tax=Methylobacterium sp. Leaf469 TaxID=1736387 RepID=UPI00070192DC|nr:DUF29 domain-containing protein [Methylobacterium sp. Leaf469]KQU02329.1 hypothetical protein ASG60_17790 [Methylobacterium sp. Leaf469]
MSKAALSPPPGRTLPEPDLYDTDLYLWTQAQAALLRTSRRQDIDWHHLAEEIESVGGSQKSEIRNRLAILLQHLLRWEFQPEKRKYGWRASIVEQRLQIDGLVDVSPSLRSWPETVLAKSYRLARVRAADETGLPEATFPEVCPNFMAQLLDDGFYPGPLAPKVV